MYLQAQFSASELARPIPQFGSQARGNYHVVCLWERPGADTIAARIQELRLSLDTVLVLYLGRLTTARRLEVIRSTHAHDLSVAMLDEVLLAFLAQEHDAGRRFQTFLRCALPFARLNPYTPFKAGSVPPEMFFGREDMARELQQPQGSCLVYGGRQLGKSALLSQVQRMFHDPDREHYAWVEDIKLLGDRQAGQQVESLWRALRDQFQRNGMLKRVTSDRPEEIERRILEVMAAEPQRLVVVLFDEADNFLDADSAQNFRVIERLRSMMTVTERRFKVVFAGLHNVQRFQGIPNQPLAHFGDPIRVGPLEAKAAQALVQEPLAVLGYRIDNAAVLRVLSYTNNHPSLIQYFCQELLKRAATRSRSVPTEIAQADVDAVYRDPMVREKIRERFEWTLALDTRYQAIAWRLIYEQLETNESFGAAYAASEIVPLMRDTWPAVFKPMGVDNVRGLLNEMVGLGVLVHGEDGKYRLRSPNLVRLMGSEGDIVTRLAELHGQQAPQPYAADTFHTILGNAKPLRYSPLTHAQERRLGPPQTGVGIVFASLLGGMDTLIDGVRAFLPTDLPPEQGRFVDLSEHAVTPEALRSALIQTYKSSVSERLIVTVVPVTAGADLRGLVETAVEVCRPRSKSRERWMRVLFVFQPVSAWIWFGMPHAQRERLEAAVDAVEWIGHWSDGSVRLRLEQHGLFDAPDALRDVLNVTGGWPLLLDRFSIAA